jgi:hypothetical protein
MKNIANSKFDITKYRPCEEALDWYNTQPDPITAWQNCHRGDWMLWIACRLNVNIHLLTLTKGYCAATVLHLMKDQRSIVAVKTSIKFGRYKVTRQQLNIAAYAAYAAYDDAAYDDAAAYADDANTAAAYTAYAAANTAGYAAYVVTNTAATYAAYVVTNTIKKQNQLQIADICRKYLTKAVMAKIKSK